MRKSYRVQVEYEAFDPEYDRELERKVGRDCAGSGMGFGVRDIGWVYYRKDAAERAFKKLKRFRRYNTKVELTVLDEDYYDD